MCEYRSAASTAWYTGWPAATNVATAVMVGSAASAYACCVAYQITAET